LENWKCKEQLASFKSVSLVHARREL